MNNKGPLVIVTTVSGAFRVDLEATQARRPMGSVEGAYNAITTVRGKVQAGELMINGFGEVFALEPGSAIAYTYVPGSSLPAAEAWAEDEYS